MGLRPPHEAGQRVAKLLLVETITVRASHQDLRRGLAIVGLESGIGPDAAEPIGSLELTEFTGKVQRCTSVFVGGVERGARAVQPLSYVEETPVAGGVQQCPSVGVGRVERGARAVQPLRPTGRRRGGP